MTTFVGATEYSDEGIAIVEDSAGKYAVTKESPDPVVVYDNPVVSAWFGSRHPCALLQSRQAMMT